MAKISVLFGTELQAEFNLDKDEMKVGRSVDCEIVVDNMGISRHHCSIVKEGEQWIVVDKGSNNGTFLDGGRITRSPLKDQSRIVLGKHNLVYDAYGYASETQVKASASMGSEMTMFVDPAQMAKMQEDLKKGLAPMVLSLIQGGREVNCKLNKSETLIGKGMFCDVPAKGLFVKEIQAKIIKSENGHRIVHQGGFRSVRVNGNKIKDSLLNAGDIIRIAGSTMTYKQQ